MDDCCEYCENNKATLRIRHRKFQNIELGVCPICFTKEKENEFSRFEVVEAVNNQLNK